MLSHRPRHLTRFGRAPDVRDVAVGLGVAATETSEDDGVEFGITMAAQQRSDYLT